MNKKLMFILWGAMYAVCAGFGFVAQPAGALKILMIILTLGFFAVGGTILWQAKAARDYGIIGLIRSLSLAWLIATGVMIIANILSVLAPQGLGDVLFYMLVVVSSPMVCGQSWVLSLFLWACLMVISHKMMKIRRKKSR